MHYERVVELPEKRYLEKATAEEGEMEVRLGLTTMTRRVKRRKLDRGLRSPQLFYTCPRLPRASAKEWWQKPQLIIKSSEQAS